MAKVKEDLDIDGVQRLIQEGIRNQVARPNLYAYKPHPKQMDFHTAEEHTRLYIGGNRSGKTTAGVVEDCYWLMKRHPYRRIGLPEGPVRGRAVAVDFNAGVATILLPEFARWLPPSFLINGAWEDSYNKEMRTLTLANGSFVEFKSYDQDLEKFAGTSRHFTHYDEEPPHHIFNECQARLVDTNGYSWLTMTPVEGMTWIYEGLYKPGVTGDDPDVSVIEVEMLDNPHITPEAAERYLKTLSKEERQAREKGLIVSLGGLVFKDFSREVHVVQPDIFPGGLPPKSWSWYVSIDHGFNNPTAMLWHAVGPYGQVITFDEHYESEMTVKEHAAVFHEKCKAHGKYPDFIVGDPAMAQRQAITGTSIQQEYSEHDIVIALANNDVAPGIDKMTKYLRGRYEEKDPMFGLTSTLAMWRITSNCADLVKEIEKLHWQKYTSRKTQFENNKQEKIQKKDDHACDSARYFFSFMPDLSPERISGYAINASINHAQGELGATNTVPPAGRVDKNAITTTPSDTKWALSAVGTDMQGLEY